MAGERFEGLKGIVPEELRQALIAETEHADPLESPEVVRQSVLATAGNEAAGMVDASATALQSEIAQASSDAASGLSSEVAVLNRVIESNYNELSSEARGLASAVGAALRSEISAMVASASAALASEVSVLNDRVGKMYKVATADATPTLLASITPLPFKSVRIIAKIQGQRVDRLERAAYTIEALARAVPSFGTLTLSTDAPSDSDDVTIGTTVYTWKTTLSTGPSVPYEVLIGTGGTAAARMEASIDNLVKAIMLSGTDDVEYGAGTEVHPDVTAVKASVATMEAVAKVPGVAGDAIDSTENGANTAWGGVTLASGSDMTVSTIANTTNDDHEDDAAWDKAIAANGVDVEIKVTGAALTAINWLAEIHMVELL